MPYQAERDATISKVIGTTKNVEGKKVAHYESVTYPEGAVIFEQDIAPHVLRRLEDGSDDRLSGLLRYIDPAEARQILGEQLQDSESQSGEEEILHQEEREGIPASPSVDPEQTVEPPYEEANTSDEKPEETDGDVATDDQTVGQGTGTTEDEATAEEETEGSSESEGTADGDAEQEPESEGSSDEDQQDGQYQSGDGQEESGEDKFSNLDRKALLAAAKAVKISGRTKMDDDKLRAALREKQE